MAKDKFERTKPHVNVGVIGRRGQKAAHLPHSIGCQTMAPGTYDQFELQEVLKRIGLSSDGARQVATGDPVLSRADRMLLSHTLLEQMTD